jgi:hypothetical protein
VRDIIGDMMLAVVLLLAVYVPFLSAKLLLHRASVLKPQNDLDPFEQIGQFLVRFGRGSTLDGYPVEEVRNAVSVLAKSQNALKSMDGVAHQFRNVVKERYHLCSYGRTCKP